jgi:hypothetical protein
MSGPKPLAAADPSKRTSATNRPLDEDATVLTNSSIKCRWNDKEFESGNHVVSGGKCYECSDGKCDID